MRRVVVIGNSGSGKTSLSRSLSQRLSLPHFELDSIYHQAGWQPLAEAEFRARVEGFTSADAWVADGNYRAVRDLVWTRADTIVWLDLGRPTVTWQIVRRTLGRVFRRQELWNGNRERIGNLFSLRPEKSIIAWSLSQHSVYRRKYLEVFASGFYGDAVLVRLRSRRAVRDFLAAAQ